MVGILDNKKIAELVVEHDAHNYEKINPETLATIVEDVTKTESQQKDFTVQQHIDDKSIHLTQSDIENITSDNLKADNIKAGANIIIDREEGTNNLTISASEVPIDDFLTAEDIIPEDTTITITPIEDTKKINIRANIPDVSKFVKQENIRAGNDRIIVELDPESNDVTLYGHSDMYKAGKGIKITEDMEIINTLPDKLITLNEGSNITIEGEYPEFTISSTDKIKISDWATDVNYQLDDFCIYNNSLFKCIEEHLSAGAFDSSKWQLIAGWSAQRQIFDIVEETDTLHLNQAVPNKDALIINISGILQQSQNYELEPDGQTIRFINTLPLNSLVEVIIMSNVVLDTYDNNVNIEDWKPNTSFAEGNICIYENGIYQCTNRHISTDIFEKNNWKLICGYVKNSYFFKNDNEVTTSITLPESIYKTSDILVNVGNTLLQSNNYTLDETGKIITFNNPIEPGISIEIIVFSNAVLQQSEIPSPVNKFNNFLISNENGTGFILIDKNKTYQILGLTNLMDFNNKGGKLLGINKSETDFEAISTYNLSSNVKVRDIPNGFIASIIKGIKEPEFIGMTKTKNDKLQFTAGSVMSKNGSVMMHIDEPITKNPNVEFSHGDNNGCMIGYGMDDWSAPVMTSNTTPFGMIVVSEEQTDREGWRVMDGLQGSGNGWLVNNTTATWEYIIPYEIVVESIDFYNQTSGVNNHSKDIDIWVDNSANVVASFTAVNKDYGHSHVDISEPIAGKSIGLTIKNSYGTAVGANEIKINAKYKNYLSKNNFYYIYIISNDDGTFNDIITSTYDESTISNHLPSGYTNYSLIGTFNTDNDWNIKNIYPNKNMKDSYVNGSLNGEVSNNKITQYLYNSIDKKPCQVVEQWGSTTPTSGNVTFPQPYTKLLYVMANGEKITSSSASGFTVNTSVTTPLSWVAKGII